MVRSLRRIAVLVSLATFLVLAGCHWLDPPQEYGSVTIHLSSGIGAATIDPPISMTIASYDVVLTGPGETVSRSVPAGETSVTIAGLVPGEWTVEVNAKNDEDPPVIIASDTTTVTVTARQEATAEVTVVPVSGEGTLTVAIDWPDGAVADPSLASTLTREGGISTDISQRFSIDTAGAPDVAVYSDSWDSGYYTLSVNLYDGADIVWGTTAAVRILEGETSGGSYSLGEDDMNLVEVGSVKINVGADLRNPYEISISGLQSTIGVSEDMTLRTILAPPDDPDSYEWFINNELRSDQYDASIVIGPAGIELGPGNYRVDVVVRRGSVVSSAGVQFSVVESRAGAVDWSFETGGNITCGPAIADDGTIYVGSYDSNVYAINADGTPKWTFATGGSVAATPAIANDGTVYVGSQDGFLYAVNPDGTQRWSFPTGDEVFAAAAVDTHGFVYVGSRNGYLFAVNPGGTERWRFQTGDYVSSSPSVGVDGTIYVGSRDRALYAVNPDGTQKWRFATGDTVESSPALGYDGTIYVGSHDGNVYAVSPDGAETWAFATGDIVSSSPAVAADGTIYVGSHDGNLYAITPTGTQAWKFATGDVVCSSPAIGADGTIYVGSRDGRVYAINPDGTRKWSYGTGAWVRSSPAIAGDGTVYVGSWNDVLYAFTGESGGLAESAWPMFRRDVRRTGLQPGPAYSMGDTGPAGGIVFYDKGDYSDGWRYLEAAPAWTEWTGVQWGAASTNIPGAQGTAVGTGSQNTSDIVAFLGPGSTYAGQLCDGLSYGGFDDWFLPSKDELNLMRSNLYLAGLGGFESQFYWSSSEYIDVIAWTQYFPSGAQHNTHGKYNPKGVRAARAF